MADIDSSKEGAKLSDNEEQEARQGKRPAEKVPLGFYLQWPVIQLGRSVGEIVDSYKKIFKVAPTDLKSMYLKRSRAADRGGNMRKSVHFMELAASLEPKDVDTLYQLGLAYEKNRDFKAAMQTYQKVLETKPDHAKAHYRTGLLCLRMRDFTEGIKALEAASKIEPGSAELNFRLGQAYDRMGDYNKAISCFSEAVKIKPDFLNAYKNMALTYESMGRHKESVDCLKRALELEETSF